MPAVGQPFNSFDFVYEDRGDNLCGCESAEPCKFVSPSLAPPDAIAPAQ